MDNIITHEDFVAVSSVVTHLASAEALQSLIKVHLRSAKIYLALGNTAAAASYSWEVCVYITRITDDI